MPGRRQTSDHATPSRHHSASTRDAALSRLRHLNRWLVAATVTLTGVLSDVAAHALAANTTKTSPAHASQATTQGSSSDAHSDKTSTPSLKAPTEAPRSGTQSTTQSQESGATSTSASQTSSAVVSGGS